MDINSVLTQVVQHRAPDLHLKPGHAPIIRLPNGELYVTTKVTPLKEEEIQVVAQMVAGPERYKQFQEQKEIDLLYVPKGIGRFRVNLYYDSEGTCMAFRSIPEAVPTLKEMDLPSILGDLALKPRGLVLVTGPTGSGKSTTLAAMLDHVNTNSKRHIITIEDPIEFKHFAKSSLITQREVSVHTNTFPNAIRSALRQDPNVILVGEMRDLETIAAAVTLAETGHLVLSTLHTSDAAQTVDRIIDVFPAYQQQQIRAQLAVSLVGVVSQILVPKSDNKGRVHALEIMVANDAIRNCIKEGNTHQIYSMLQIGRGEGMQTMDDALAQLVGQGVIDMEHAMSKVHDVPGFKRAVMQYMKP